MTTTTTTITTTTTTTTATITATTITATTITATTITATITRMNTRSTVRTAKYQAEKIINILGIHIKLAGASQNRPFEDQMRTIRKIYIISSRYFQVLLGHPDIMKYLENTYKKGFELISNAETKMRKEPYKTKILKIGRLLIKNIQSFQKKYRDYLEEIDTILMKKIMISDLMPLVKGYLM